MLQEHFCAPENTVKMSLHLCLCLDWGAHLLRALYYGHYLHCWLWCRLPPSPPPPKKGFLRYCNCNNSCFTVWKSEGMDWGSHSRTDSSILPRDGHVNIMQRAGSQARRLCELMRCLCWNEVPATPSSSGLICQYWLIAMNKVTYLT